MGFLKKHKSEIIVGIVVGIIIIILTPLLEPKIINFVKTNIYKEKSNTKVLIFAERYDSSLNQNKSVMDFGDKETYCLSWMYSKVSKDIPAGTWNELSLPNYDLGLAFPNSNFFKYVIYFYNYGNVPDEDIYATFVKNGRDIETLRIDKLDYEEGKSFNIDSYGRISGLEIYHKNKEELKDITDVEIFLFYCDRTKMRIN